MTPRRRADWLERYTLAAVHGGSRYYSSTYRSYVINYNLGWNVVGVLRTGVRRATRPEAWEEFARLLSSPRLPSVLSSISLASASLRGNHELR